MILNDIKNKFRLVNAYEDWKDYRLLLTDTVIEAGGGDSTKTLSVIGAGYCNDIDIRRLSAAFEKIYLVDCDAEAMGESAKTCAKAEPKTISLTGIYEADVSAYFEDTLTALREQGSKLNYEVFKEILTSKLEVLFKKLITNEKDLADQLPHSDIILCNGVCSQLFSMISFFIRSVAGSIPDSLFRDAIQAADIVEQKLKNASEAVIPVICKALLKSADCVIFGNEYSKDYPVEGAQCCIDTIRQSGSIIKEIEATWSFNRRENVEYNMLLQICKRMRNK
ncbi:MAG: hypothetical protein IK014_03020 [Lachnospiraceae bacterium]|nr:hypothetical protein [Lachnospiraceae bacterium]